MCPSALAVQTRRHKLSDVNESLILELWSVVVLKYVLPVLRDFPERLQRQAIFLSHISEMSL
jgi:hypothetical protein